MAILEFVNYKKPEKEESKKKIWLIWQNLLKFDNFKIIPG
jgi:hypothetical protein